MPTPPPNILFVRFTEAHVESVTALYSSPAVARQTLQMPFQSADLWRKRLDGDNERKVSLVATHQGEVIAQGSVEQFSRLRRSHCGSIGMGVSEKWQGQGIGKQLLITLLEVADNWMLLRRVELTVFSDNKAAIGLYQKLGFETEGVLRNYAIRDGEYTDALTMARLRH